jgi:hypothetical protein
MTEVGFMLTEVGFILNLFQFHSRHAELVSVSTPVILHLFLFHSRHAEFISVSGLWVVRDEILKQVQDDGGCVHADGSWVHTELVSVSTPVILHLFLFHSRHAEFISVSTPVMLNLFQYPLSSY